MPKPNVIHRPATNTEKIPKLFSNPFTLPLGILLNALYYPLSVVASPHKKCAIKDTQPWRSCSLLLLNYCFV
jgi:hypothetical protein